MAAKKSKPKKIRPLGEIKVGTKIVREGSTRAYQVMQIDVTGNGARMLYLQAVSDAKVTFASWESDLRYPGFSGPQWHPYVAPRKPRVKKPKPLATFVTRYDIMEDL